MRRSARPEGGVTHLATRPDSGASIWVANRFTDHLYLSVASRLLKRDRVVPCGTTIHVGGDSHGVDADDRIGVTDIQHAALEETRQLMREAKGDRRVATGLAFERLHELGWISAQERDVLHRMHELGFNATQKQNASRARPPDLSPKARRHMRSPPS